MTRFALTDEYILSRLGTVEECCERKKPNIVESGRRTVREMSYGYIHFLWWVELIDGTCIISVPPGCKDTIKAFVEKCGTPDISDRQSCSRLMKTFDSAAQIQTGKGISLYLQDEMYVCDRHTIKCIPDRADTTRITGENTPVAQGLRFPQHCLPDGIVYGVLADGHIASVAYAHRTGVYQDIVADIGVETAPGYRRRGYAKAVTAAVAWHVISKGGEALYKCAPDNIASKATALSAGFVPYGKSLIFAVK